VKGKLLIDLECLPEEGERLEGELPGEVFDLPKGDASAIGPLVYAVHAQRFGSELMLRGHLEAPFEFTCVRTLHPFIQTIRLDDAVISIEITGEGVVDATEALREEILIHFPTDPRCDDADDPQDCEINPRYLSVDKPPHDALPTPPRAASDDRWSALDGLQNLKDQP
jgi:uncharacterized metal-binding protein YceD (DUF177 family)